MPDSSSYPRLPVRLPSWEELNRRVADGINYLLAWVSRAELMDEQLLAAVGPSTFDPATGRLENWAGSNEPARSTIQFDSLTGQATITTAGFYSVTASVNWGGTGNNNWYGLNLRVDGSPVALLGGELWSNQYPAGAIASANGAYLLFLTEGQILDIAWHPSGNQIDPDGGQLMIDLLMTT